MLLRIHSPVPPLIETDRGSSLCAPAAGLEPSAPQRSGGAGGGRRPALLGGAIGPGMRAA